MSESFERCPPPDTIGAARKQVAALAAEFSVVKLVGDTMIMPELLTFKEAAALLGIGVSSLHALTAAGEVPAPIYIGSGGGSPRFGRRELTLWVANGCPSRNRWSAMRETLLRKHEGSR